MIHVEFKVLKRHKSKFEPFITIISDDVNKNKIYSNITFQIKKMIMVFSIDNSIFHSSYFIDRVYALIFFLQKIEYKERSKRSMRNTFFLLNFVLKRMKQREPCFSHISTHQPNYKTTAGN